MKVFCFFRNFAYEREYFFDMNESKQPLLGMNMEQLKGVVAGLGMPAFTAKQIAEWIYVKKVRSIDEMTSIFYAMDVDAIWTLGKRALVAYGIMCAGYLLVSWLIAHITYVKAHNASVSFDRMLTEIDGSEEEEE